MTKYTTTIEIPKDDTGDQRIYFTDDTLFVSRMMRIRKEEIDRILDFDVEKYDKINGWSVIEHFITTIDVTAPCYSSYKESNKSDKEFYDDNARYVDYVHNAMSKTYKVLLVDGKGLPNFIVINASPKSLKALEEYVFQVPNHKKI